MNFKKARIVHNSITFYTFIKALDFCGTKKLILIREPCGNVISSAH